MALAPSDRSENSPPQYELPSAPRQMNSEGAGVNCGRSVTPPGRSSAEDRERRRRKRRVAVSDSDKETGRRSAGTGGASRASSGEGGRKSRGSKGASAEKDIRDSLPTNFRAAIAEFSPPLPPALLRKLEINEVNGLGKVSTLHTTRKIGCL